MFNQKHDEMVKRAVEYQQSEFQLTHLSQERYEQLSAFMKTKGGTFGNSHGQFIVTKTTHTNNTDDETGFPLDDYDSYSLSFKLYPIDL